MSEMRRRTKNGRGGSKRSGSVSLLVLLAGTSALLLLSAIMPTRALAQNIQAFSAQFRNFNGSEANTSVAPAALATGGKAIYDVTVTVPGNINTLFVTVSSTGDLDKRVNSMWLACLVDGKPCNSGSNSQVPAFTGWVKVQDLSPAALNSATSDNNVNYSWCTPIERHSPPDPLLHKVQLRLASGNGTNTVFLEQIHVFVNGARIAGKNSANACTLGTE